MFKNDWKRHFDLREAGVYYALILLMVVLGIVTTLAGRPSYFSPTNLTNILYQSSMIAMMGVAMTVILITGNFDLSVAAVAALGAAIAVGLAGPLGFPLASLIAMLACITIGIVNGLIVQFVGINAFIVTLGTLTAIRGLVLILTDGRSLLVSTPEAKAQMVAFEGGRVPVQLALYLLGAALVVWGIVALIRLRAADETIPVRVAGNLLGGVSLIAIAFLAGPELTVAKPVIYAGIYTLIVWLVLTFTTVGRRVYATGGNAVAARLSGVNVNAYKMAGFILSSATAGFAGVLFSARLGAVNPTALQGAELTVIAAAILGGTSLFGGAGSVIKTLVGALLLFTLTNGFNILNLGANYQGVIEGSVVVIAAAIYTVGGTRRRRAAA
ncbi:ABC transporter permease [Shinella sp. 838]|uniref:ABC transporter permease n=1 Tax=Shinella sp. 838 TaxID=3038164 RepID=UPI0024153198|nr:ABC transporter permease [Shinella sp. 838]MDG4674911.1 ABC transporter permease [Shinella sp. 838]